eukprot:scaffold132175_cov17-Tisochrysis_lutea.AAC.4
MMMQKFVMWGLPPTTRGSCRESSQEAAITIGQAVMATGCQTAASYWIGDSRPGKRRLGPVPSSNHHNGTTLRGGKSDTAPSHF